MIIKSTKAAYDPRFDTFDYSEYSSKKLKSNHIGVLITTATAFAVNLISLIFIIVQGFSVLTLMCAVLLVLADAGHFVLARVTNYRFAYAKKTAILYFVISAGLSAVIFFCGFTPSAAYVFSIAAVTVFALSRIVLLSAFGVTVRSAAGSAKPFGIIAGSAAVGAVVLAGILVFCVSAGFYGQNYGTGTGYRAISYELREEDGEKYYVADKVLSGAAEHVVVPETFNGKPVREVSGNVFTASGVKDITLSGSSLVTITDKEALRSFSGDTKITVPKQLTDAYRLSLYSGENSLSSVGYSVQDKFMSCIVPQVDAGEAYVAFRYNTDNLPDTFTEGGIRFIPSIVVKKGESITADSLGAYKDAYLNRDNLEWNFYNNARKHMLGMTYGDNTVVGTPVTKSVTVDIDFTDVYKITFEKGDTYAFNPENWVTDEFISTAVNNLDMHQSRKGCTAVWTGKSVKGASQILNNKEEVLSYAVKNRDCVTMTPNWKVIIPDIKSFRASNDSYTYGDNVTLIADVEHELPLKYSLRDFDSNPVGGFGDTEISTYDLGILTPGEYKYVVEVTATDEHDPALFSESMQFVTLTVKRKAIKVNWTFPESAVYKREDYYATCSINPSDFVSGDDYALTQPDGRSSAGNHLLMTGFQDEQANDKYYLLGSSGTLNISPRPLTAVWSDLTFEYDGQHHAPTASVTLLSGDGGRVNTSGATNAGTHTSFAAISNSNYSITNDTQAFTVTPKEVAASWTVGSYTYNGSVQAPTATYRDVNSQLRALTVSGGQTNAGSGYTATASLSDSNYRLTNATTTFSIARATAGVTWGSTSLTYNGSVQAPTATYRDVNSQLRALVVSGGQTNAGKGYIATASLPSSASNYVLEGSTTTTFSINPQILPVIWNKNSFTATDAVRVPTATNLAGLNATYTYKDASGNIVSSVTEPGTYTASVSVASGNYTLANTTITFTVRAAETNKE